MFYGSLTLLIILQTFCTLKEKLTLAICFFSLHLSKPYQLVFEGKGTFEHMYNVNDMGLLIFHTQISFFS